MKRFLSIFIVSLFLWPASCSPAGDEPQETVPPQETQSPEDDAGGGNGGDANTDKGDANTDKGDNNTDKDDKDGDKDDDNTDKDDKDPAMRRNITLTIGTAVFAATLEENPAADALLEMLPLTLDMNELNGNEKYVYLPESLPEEPYRPGTIETGDLLLWGDNCVVLFYETFASGYSYTRLGRIDNPEKLAEAVGRGRITVLWERK